MAESKAEVNGRIHGYLRWQAARPPLDAHSAAEYLFDEPCVRFEAEPTDTLVAQPNWRLEGTAGSLSLGVGGEHSPTVLRALNRLGATTDDVTGLLRHLEGDHTVAQLMQLPAGKQLLSPLLRDTLGVRLFTPLAVAQCERAIAASEVTRFPGSPYEVHRPYWRNMAAVRSELTQLPQALESSTCLIRFLQALHRIALTGADGQTYYAPPSRVGGQAIVPGALHTELGKHRSTSDGIRILSGLRVGVPPIGGLMYQTLLCTSVGDAAALLPRRHQGADGVHWGDCVVGRTAAESKNRPWFCPPRPVTPAHWSQLKSLLTMALKPLSTPGSHADPSARETSRSSNIRHLALFHQRFVQLHPFACANQSLAMNLINFGLKAMGLAPIPHLILDHFALRLRPDAYATVFQRAVSTYQPTGATLAEQYRHLATARNAAFALTAELEQIDDQQAATVHANTHSAAKRWLLLA